ncbi:MAG TPA: hypothetical protein VNX65_02430 [Patescibacteria group bacterium]|jgi:hypothetical protein|nr:hypothetical protein [Patescibacteria group bacterium]
MGYLNTVLETEILNLPSDNNYWIKYYKRYTYGESKRVRRLGDNTEVGDAILKAMICDWNLDDENGNKLDINDENIDRLDNIDSTALINAVSEVLSRNEKKDSPNQ